jgi:hypothetical protein
MSTVYILYIYIYMSPRCRQYGRTASMRRNERSRSITLSFHVSTVLAKFRSRLVDCHILQSRSMWSTCRLLYESSKLATCMYMYRSRQVDSVCARRSQDKCVISLNQSNVACRSRCIRRWSRSWLMPGWIQQYFAVPIDARQGNTGEYKWIILLSRTRTPKL